MNVPRRPTPEELYLEKKRAELAVLESQLAERELELHTARGSLLAFEKQYEAEVGSRFDRLDELKMRIAELMPPKAIESETSGDGSDAKAQAAAKSRPRPRRKPPEAKPSEGDPKEKKEPAPARHPADFNPAESLKRLYRDVAKSLHPDLADSDENRGHRHEFMVRANEAYEAGDEKRLLAVFHEWEEAPESVKGAGAGADLVRVIRKIAACEKRIVTIAMEMQELQTTGLFGMKMMAQEAAQFERDLLAEMTGRLDAEIEAAQQYLAMLQEKLATDGAPMNTDEKQKQGLTDEAQMNTDGSS